MYGSWVNALPSRFVEELPEDHITAQSDSGLYTPGRSSHWDSSGYQSEPSVSSSRLDRTEKRSIDGTFTTGDIVFHNKFGQGTIIHIDGQKLDINFDHAGQKRVMDSFVEKV